MALFRNPPVESGQVGVKLRVSLCDVLSYVSAKTLVFLDLAENCSFLNWKPAVPTIELMDGHYLTFATGSEYRGGCPGFQSQIIMPNGIPPDKLHLRPGSLIELMPATTAIPVGPGHPDRMVQAILVVRAKDTPLSPSLKRFACLVHACLVHD